MGNTNIRDIDVITRMAKAESTSILGNWVLIEAKTMEDPYLRDKTLKDLLNEFDKQIEQYPDHFKEVNKYAQNAFNEVAPDFISVVENPSYKINLNITDSPSIIFSVSNYQDFDKIRYEVFVDSDELYVAYSIYKNNSLYARDSGEHYGIIEQLKTILNKPTDTYGVKLIQQAYYSHPTTTERFESYEEAI